MSRHMDDSELLRHCQTEISKLLKLLENFSKSGIEKLKKRAMLIAYWIRTYVYYLSNEDSFSSESVFRLKRGSVIRVEFGYRIGRELGGRHYAVVLDTNNSLHRNTVTVVPLGSQKDNKNEDKYSVALKDGFYSTIVKKLEALISDATHSLSDAKAMEQTIKSASSPEKESLRAIQRQRTKDANQLIEKANHWFSEISNMKEGSIAHVDQITTISKQRISQPLDKTHPLYGVRITPDDLNAIDQCIMQLYFPDKTKLKA